MIVKSDGVRHLVRDIKLRVRKHSFEINNTLEEIGQVKGDDTHPDSDGLMHTLPFGCALWNKQGKRLKKANFYRKEHFLTEKNNLHFSTF